MIVSNAIRALAVAACLCALSACKDDKSAAPEAPKVSAEQAEVQKYNAYVDVANSAGAYGDAVDDYEKHVQPYLDGKKPLKELYFNAPSSLERLKAALDKAQSMAPAMADLDGPARAYAEAMGKAAPLSSDINNYIDAKTYQSDKGAHGREIQPALLASLKALAVAQDGFLSAIEARDRARTKAEFENAKKDTAAYFRAGLIYYGKQSMDRAEGVLAGKGLGDQVEPFKQALDQANTMALGYDGKIRESNNKGCSSLMLHANTFFSKGRDIIQRTTDGTYAQEAKRPAPFSMMPSQQGRDAHDLQQDFTNLINELNIDRC